MLNKIVICLLLISNFLNNGRCANLNSCNNHLSYLNMNPSDCWYNPDVNLNIPDIITSHGYPLEFYDVTTADDYTITMFRMRQKNRKGIVYLQHPFFTNSIVWIDKGNSSLAFILYDAGYEIWIGHLRESIYGRRHKFKKVSTKEFWNFSFHETGIYDIPAQVDLIVNVSQAKPQEITYIGLSMSGTSALVYASMIPKQSEKYINLFVLMAPGGTVRHIPQIFYEIAKSTSNIEELFKWFGFYELTWANNYIRGFDFCFHAPIMYLCNLLELILFGNGDDLNPEWSVLKYAHKPDAVVLKTVVHFAQITDSKMFQMYDYGKDKNFERYGRYKPPPYPLQNIRVPIFVLYSDADHLVAKDDIENLYELLPERAKFYGKLFIEHLSHTSFIYGKRVKELVYQPILNLINKVTKTRNDGLLGK